MGQQMCIVTSAADVASLYRNPKAFQSHDLLKQMWAGFGMTPQSLTRMWTMPSPALPQKPVIEAMHDIYWLQLHPGAKLEALPKPLLGRLDVMLRWDQLMTWPMALAPAAGNQDAVVPHVRMPLLLMCSYAMHDAATRAFFGDALLAAGPRLLERFSVFDTYVWKLFVSPRFVSGKVRRARDGIVDALVRYVSLPTEQRPGAAWLERAREEALPSIGLDDQKIATQLLGDYWA
jgi:hypothetical protein